MTATGRLRLLALGAALAVAVVSAAAGTAGARPTTAPPASKAGSPWYLALGDSLSQGIQPSADGTGVETDQGYTNHLYYRYKQQVAGLKITKLGCGGATTGTMLNGGGRCSYPKGSQLAQAVNFLDTHHAALVTIDIGANDIFPCISHRGVNQTCVQAGFRATKEQLPVILNKLRTAAGPSVRIVGMTYYDPFLAWWLTGSRGQSIAKASLSAVVDFNNLLVKIFGAAKDPIADVQGSFDSRDSAVLPNLALPVNVQKICLYTFVCSAAPFGPNKHANLVGYGVIANAFASAIGRLGTSG